MHESRYLLSLPLPVQASRISHSDEADSERRLRLYCWTGICTRIRIQAPGIIEISRGPGLVTSIAVIMVPDALSLISLAENIIQFLDFGFKLVSKGHEIY